MFCLLLPVSKNFLLIPLADLKTDMTHVIVTGGAGFIGSNIVDSLLNLNYRVTVVDNLDHFYDPEIKRSNIQHHINNPGFIFHKLDITDIEALQNKLTDNYQAIIHLAAKVGVRESIVNPVAYSKVNTDGTLNLLNFAKEKGIRQFVFASSSSVYGINPSIPWKEETEIDSIISPYAVSKRAAELYGMTFSRLYDIRFLVLRLFTVYGPRQRPDLAINKFVYEVMGKKPLKIFGEGDSKRDYTYVTDVADAFIKALNYKESNFEIFNIGHSTPVSLLELIQKIERIFNSKAIVEFTGMQTGDVPVTFANISKALKFLGYNPKIDIDAGLQLYKEWLEFEKRISGNK
jgi:UDP-glucuronate 4-epimerase